MWSSFATVLLCLTLATGQELNPLELKPLARAHRFVPYRRLRNVCSIFQEARLLMARASIFLVVIPVSGASWQGGWSGVGNIDSKENVR